MPTSDTVESTRDAEDATPMTTPRTTTTRPTGTAGADERLRRAWRAAHSPTDGVPRWARLAAYAVPFTVLPSGVWRIGEMLVGDDRVGGRGDVPVWLPMELYVVVLTIVSEVLAFTAVGLVARWGERVPRWVPGLGGRRVPTLAAAVPAALGALVLTAMWTTALYCAAAGVTLRGDSASDAVPSQGGGWEAAWFYLCYAPLALWGPLLAAVTVAYVRRRRDAALPLDGPRQGSTV